MLVVEDAADLRVVEGELSTVEAAAAVLPGVDVVVHLAAAMKGTPDHIFGSTVVATQNLLEAARRAEKRPRFVHCSSFAVYGVAELPRGAVIDETTPRVVALLNLSRDQLDRAKEVAMMAQMWRTALAAHPAAHVVANADDPMVVWAAVNTAELPPPPGAKVLHSSRLVVHVPESATDPQCLSHEEYQPVCFFNLRASLQKSLPRALWPAFPEVVLGSFEDVGPGDYFLQVDVTLDALPPDAVGPGWSAGARQGVDVGTGHVSRWARDRVRVGWRHLDRSGDRR